MDSLQIGRGSKFTYLILRSVYFLDYNALNARQSLRHIDPKYNKNLADFRLRNEVLNDVRLQDKVMKYDSIRAWHWNAYQPRRCWQRFPISVDF